MKALRNAWAVSALALALGACGPSADGDHVAGSSDVGHSSAAVTGGKCPAGPTVMGVDVSAYQGNVNWGAARAAGVNFGIARVSDGYYQDGTFTQNWNGLKAAGLIRGAYQFFEPGEDPVAQANIVISKVGRLGYGDLPVMLDVEVTGGQSAATIVAKIHQWVNAIRAGTGRDPFIYTGAYFWDGSVGGSADFAGLALNVAWYGTNCPGTPNAWPYWSFHQYSSTGSIPGIAGNVDLDVWNGDLAHLLTFAGETTTGFQVGGAIGAHYAALGGASSFLGAPTSNETSTVCGGGRYNTFQNGAITWTPTVGAWATTGAIRAEWGALQYECGPLGFPTTDEMPTVCGGGRFNNFEHGAITWNPTVGAHMTMGAIRAKWASLKYECGALGFPTTDETATACGGGRYNNFEHGAILWSPATGAHISWGGIRAKYASLGFECSALGFPTSDEYNWNGGIRQDYQNGHYIFWNGQATVH